MVLKCGEMSVKQTCAGKEFQTDGEETEEEREAK